MKLGRLDVPTNRNLVGYDFFSPSGRFFVQHVEAEKKLVGFRLFAIPSGKVLFTSPHPPNQLANLPFVFSPDDRLMAFPGDGDTIEVLDTANGNVRQLLGWRPDLAGMSLRFRIGGFSTPAFSPDSKLFASWNFDNDNIHIWDLTTGKERLRLPPKEAMRGCATLAWSPDGRTLAVGFQRKIQMFEVSTGKLRREFEGHQGAIRSLAFSPDGRLLASGSADTTVLIWDVWGREARRAGNVSCRVLSPSARRVYPATNVAGSPTSSGQIPSSSLHPSLLSRHIEQSGRCRHGAYPLWRAFGHGSTGGRMCTD